MKKYILSLLFLIMPCSTVVAEEFNTVMTTVSVVKVDSIVWTFVRHIKTNVIGHIVHNWIYSKEWWWNGQDLDEPPTGIPYDPTYAYQDNTKFHSPNIEKVRNQICTLGGEEDQYRQVYTEHIEIATVPVQVSVYDVESSSFNKIR